MIKSKSNPSHMQHSFKATPQANIQRSSFDRTSTLKTTFDFGDLIPIFVDEVLPGDTFNLNMAGFGRLATPAFPIMDNLHLETFFFFVPNRLIWDNSHKFHGEQIDPGDSIDFLVPQLTTPSGGYLEGSLMDYMGVPTQENIANINALHSRAYNLIFNEHFRDQNLIDSLVVDKDDGPDTDTDYTIQKRGKRADYFTSCLPSPQKGDSVTLPLNGEASVTGIGVNNSSYFNATNITNLKESIGGASSVTYADGGSFNNGNAYLHAEESPDSPGYLNIKADLTTATSATINDIREAFQIQKVLEKDARNGTRYTEIVRSHFGVTSPDARLQRPEYLGGGHSPINVNPIAQTSSTDGTSPQGNLSGYGQVDFNGHGFTKSFTEHGVIIGIACARADLTYQQGLNKMWSRQERFDFYLPDLAHLGEQAVLTKEIFADGSATDETVFGYIPRYDEYRYKPSQITGAMRSNASTPLDVWHCAQDFASAPTLNETFIQENPPIDRNIAIPSEPHLLFDAYFKLTCARPLPTFAIPGLKSHF